MRRLLSLSTCFFPFGASSGLPCSDKLIWQNEETCRIRTHYYIILAIADVHGVGDPRTWGHGLQYRKDKTVHNLCAPSGISDNRFS